MWLARELTGDPAWTARAQRWTAPIASQVNRTDTHDLGFVVDDSFGDELRRRGPAPATSSPPPARSPPGTRPKVHAIKSWDTEGDDDQRGTWRFPVIIDTTMNLALLDRAAALPGGDPAWKDIATQHALTASRTNMRPDGSVAHVAVFDPDTGAFLKRDTWQGAAPDSTWSRGQGWAIHGFAAQARAADNPELRAAARRPPTGGSPTPRRAAACRPWDFSKPTEERDTSAAAVAASGLLDLADQVGGADGDRYRQAAGETLDELATKDVAPSGPALLAHADRREAAGRRGRRRDRLRRLLLPRGGQALVGPGARRAPLSPRLSRVSPGRVRLVSAAAAGPDPPTPGRTRACCSSTTRTARAAARARRTPSRATCASSRPDLDVQLVPTEYAGHARRIAESAARTYRPLVVSVSRRRRLQRGRRRARWPRATASHRHRRRGRLGGQRQRPPPRHPPSARSPRRSPTASSSTSTCCG